MKEFETLLVVVHSQDDGEIVINKAATLAKACNAKLHVTKVVYRGFVDLSVHEVTDMQALKTQLLKAEQDFLNDLIDPLVGMGITITASAVWHKHAFEGILDVRENCRADLIIKSTNHPVDELIRTPQDWNLLRHSPVPVMLVKPAVWQATPSIVAAVDTSEPEQANLNRKIVRQADDTAECLGGQVRLAEIYPDVEQWVGPITISIDFSQVRARIRRELNERLESLASDCGVHTTGILIEEGEPAEALRDLISREQVDVLVMGTVQRTGVTGMLLGNTSEAILHTINSDVLVVTD